MVNRELKSISLTLPIFLFSLASLPFFILVAPANLFQGQLQCCLTVAIDRCPRADLDVCKTGYDTFSL